MRRVVSPPVHHLDSTHQPPHSPISTHTDPASSVASAARMTNVRHCAAGALSAARTRSTLGLTSCPAPALPRSAVAKPPPARPLEATTSRNQQLWSPAVTARVDRPRWPHALAACSGRMLRPIDAAIRYAPTRSPTPRVPPPGAAAPRCVDGSRRTTVRSPGAPACNPGRTALQ